MMSYRQVQVVQRRKMLETFPSLLVLQLLNTNIRLIYLFSLLFGLLGSVIRQQNTFLDSASRMGPSCRVHYIKLHQTESAFSS